MSISKFPTTALAASIALAVLSGCSGSSQIAPTPLAQTGVGGTSIQRPAFQNRRLNSFLAMHGGIVAGHRGLATPSFMKRAAVRKPLVFVVDNWNNVVDIFLQAKSHKSVGQITAPTGSYLNGAATDSARNLYLTDLTEVTQHECCNSSSILVYAPPYTGTPAALLDAGNFAGNVAVSPAGIVGVANGCTAPSCPPDTGSVSFYAPNSAVPCATIAVNASVGYPAFDKRGNLFFLGTYTPSQGPGYAVMGEVKGGCSAKKSEPLTTTNGLAFPQAIHTDKADRIAILDVEPVGSQYTFTIYTYNHPKKGSLGNPVSSSPLTTSNFFIYDFAFVALGRSLYTSEQGYANYGLTGFSNEYAYPAGGAPESIIDVTTDGIPAGIAVTPMLGP